MIARSGHGLWLAATAGSIGLHGAVGLTLYAMPMPEIRKAPPTEIRFETPDRGAAAPLSPGSQTPSLIPRVSATAVSLSVPAQGAAEQASILLPSESQAALSPVPKAVAARPAPQAIRPATIETEAAGIPTPPAIEPAPPQDVKASEPPDALAATEVASVGVADATSPAPADGIALDSAIAEAADPGVAVPPVASQSLDPAPRQPTAIASPTGVPGLPLAAAVSAALSPTASPSEIATVPEIPPSTAVPHAAGNSGSVAPVAAALPSASAPIARAAPIMAAVPTALAAALAKATSGAAPVALAPGPAAAGGAKIVTMPRIAAAPVSRDTPAPAATVTAATAPVVVGATPAEPQPAAAVVATGDEQLAMIMRPSAVGADSGSATKGGRLRVGDFLAARDGDECLLALPISMGAQEASMEAFAIQPEAVARLGSAYEKESGISLKTDTRAVSESQCSALTFARSLAAYPNFPLRLTLNESRIRSGSVLSGVISGLRKPTLYLVVVDDEGKAELMDANLDVRSTITSFRAPMTLTSGPVSSVQLLVAIAADGPLDTVPRRPGMPAEEYFSRLATEIVMGNRSIAYGITSFEVQ